MKITKNCSNDTTFFSSFFLATYQFTCSKSLRFLKTSKGIPISHHSHPQNANKLHKGRHSSAPAPPSSSLGQYTTIHLHLQRRCKARRGSREVVPTFPLHWNLKQCSVSKLICQYSFHLLAAVHVYASGAKTAPAVLGFFEHMHFRHAMACWRSWELATHAHATSLLGLGGKPPPESAARILASEAFTCVKQSPTNPALLLTDGAPCYRFLSAKFGWRHEACNHSKGIFCIKKRIKTKRSWFTQVEWIQCGGCLNQQFLVAVRPGWTATSILNWCEASGFGNGVGWTPKKMLWRKLVACWTSACAAEREKNPRVFNTKIHAIYRPWC